MWLELNKELKAKKAFEKKLLQTILDSDHLKQLIDGARKQWEFDQLTLQPFNYAILQDLVNTSRHGVTIGITFADGTKLNLHPEKSAEEVKEIAQRQEQLRTIYPHG